MFLSYKDIEIIKNKGYDEDFFVRKKNSWLLLKNKNRRCVFHDGSKCLIYESQPEGCRLFPLIFDDDYKIAVVDEECPYKKSFKFHSDDIERLNELIDRLKSERQMRK